MGDFRIWPISMFAVAQQFGSDQRQSGHTADAFDPSKMTHHAISRSPFAVPHNALPMPVVW